VAAGGRRGYLRRRRSLGRARVILPSGVGALGGDETYEGENVSWPECIAMFSSRPLYSGAGSVGKTLVPQYLAWIHPTNTEAIQTL
jgi:hypothetical protein